MLLVLIVAISLHTVMYGSDEAKKATQKVLSGQVVSIGFTDDEPAQVPIEHARFFTSFKGILEDLGVTTEESLQSNSPKKVFLSLYDIVQLYDRTDEVNRQVIIEKFLENKLEDMLTP